MGPPLPSPVEQNPTQTMTESCIISKMETVIVPKPKQWNFWVAEILAVAKEHSGLRPREDMTNYVEVHAKQLGICKNCEAVVFYSESPIIEETEVCLFCERTAVVTLETLLDYL